jgi:hypothetical protein
LFTKLPEVETEENLKNLLATELKSKNIGMV